MKQFLEVGKLNNTHGIKGELKMQLWCDDINYLSNLKPCILMIMGKRALMFCQSGLKKNLAIIKLKGIDTIAQAEEIKGKILYCNRDDATIDEEVNYIADLIGCRVVDIDNGKEYGKVVDVLNYGSCDIYDTVSSGKHILIPATPDIVKEINTQYQIIKIKAMKGLFDEN
ncbi:MAG: ribosome maturation factor RimM [Eubacterium sp.]